MARQVRDVQDPVWAAQLEKIAARYGIEVRRSSELNSVDASTRTVDIVDNNAGAKDTPPFDLSTSCRHKARQTSSEPAHWPTLPARSDTSTSTNTPCGTSDSATSSRSANLPTSKTGAAIRKQAPAVVANLLAVLEGREPHHRYNGYASCPLVTARDKMLLAEFDYELKPTPSIPFIDTTKERRDM